MALARRKQDLERYYLASQWQLMWRKFRHHTLARIGIGVLAVLYVGALFCEFISTQDIFEQHPDRIFVPPQRIHFIDSRGFHLRPFVYDYTMRMNLETLSRSYVEDTSREYPIRFFVHGDPYKFWGLFRTDIHLFGIGGTEGSLFLFGTDQLGRDLFSRNLYASRISLTIGLVGVAISFLLGCVIGGISGFFGGIVDTIIQRIIEFLICIPSIPVWMGLSAALPKKWPSTLVYFGITLILSIIGWTGLARVVRGKILALREEDFAMAAKVSGSRPWNTITRHLIPSFLSYLIVHITLAIPGMILGETALSFLGLGIQPPAVSWGVLLQNAQNVRTVSTNPWLLIPGLFVIVVVLCFNFVGDGLRDAADPYK